MTPNATGPLGTSAAPDGGTMPTPVIRCFEPADHPAARALWGATPGVGLSAADERDPIERFLARNPGLSFLAALDGRVIGTILCGHDGRRGLIHHLVVAPDCRRRGLGHTLLRRGLGALRGAGIDKCHLLVFGSNDAGLAFWRSVGASERRELALFSLPTTGPALAEEAKALGIAVAGCLGIPPERVHVEYAPPGSGRVAFGGALSR